MATFIIPDNGDDLARLIRLDIDRSVTVEYTTIITEHPVEDGAPVNDHIRVMGERISIEGFVTNTPRFDEARGNRGTFSEIAIDAEPYDPPILPTPGSLLNAGIEVLGDALGLNGAAPKAFNPLSFPTPFNAVTETEEALDTLRKEGALCQVITSSRRFSDMVIETATKSQTRDDGTGASFLIQMRKLRIVRVATTTGVVLPEEPRGVPLAAQGVNGAKTPDEADEILNAAKTLKDKFLSESFLNAGAKKLGL